MVGDFLSCAEYCVDREADAEYCVDGGAWYDVDREADAEYGIDNEEYVENAASESELCSVASLRSKRPGWVCWLATWSACKLGGADKWVDNVENEEDKWDAERGVDNDVDGCENEDDDKGGADNIASDVKDEFVRFCVKDGDDDGKADGVVDKSNGVEREGVCR